MSQFYSNKPETFEMYYTIFNTINECGFMTKFAF